MVETLQPDVIGVTESWGDDEISDGEFSLPGFTLFRRDRASEHRGGGVLLYVRCEFNPIEVTLSSQFVEQVWCSIQIKNGQELLIGVCYRSPNAAITGPDNDQKLLDTLTEVYNRPLLLMGDFNYPDIDWSTSIGGSVTSQRFVDGVEDGFLTQHVLDGTCNGAVLDLVISSEPEMIDVVSVLDKFSSSDHNLLQWEVKLSPIVSAFNCSRLDYTRADFDGMCEALRGMDWQSILWGDANNQWSTFLCILKQLESQFVPLRKSNKRHHKVPWMTYKAIKLVNHKHKLYKKYKSVRHPAYAKAAREATREVRRAKRNFEKKLSENIDTDRKSFYSYVRSRSRAKEVIGSLTDDSGSTTVLPADLADKFNTYFSSVFTTENMSSIPSADYVYTGCETDRLLEIQIELGTVKKVFDKFRCDKAGGTDELSSRLLIELKEVICYPVMKIISESLLTGIVPDDWKTANVTPIFKKGNRQRVENYRPVSLTSLIGKVCETVIRDAILDHLDRHQLIVDSQHGFRKGGSCLSNLLQFLDAVTGSLDRNNCIDVVYLDFAKAFDKVPHVRLLDKVSKHGIGGKVWSWIKEWLRDRKQRVCISGHSSSWVPVTSGVPQGSVLGPLLFLIFINDLESGLLSSLLKFADDTKVFCQVNGQHDREQLQADLNCLTEWSDKWQMPFNTSKCRVMHLGRANNKYEYRMGNHTLEVTTEEKDLGVMISSNLKASRQCQQAYAKASRALGLIHRSISFKSPYVLLRLYKSLVRPHLEYCISAWAPHYVKDKVLLERVQHRFTRMVPGMKHLSYDTRLAQLGLWTLEERRHRADLLEVFRMYKGLSLTPFCQFFTLSPVNSTRGHSAKVLKHRCSLDLRRFFFSERVIDRWNSLPQSVIDSSSINVFKNGLNTMRRDSMGFFMD